MREPTRMKPTFFESPAGFREWLERHHTSATELWVGFHKKKSGKPSMTWPESVDQALCFGWIDGVRTGIDEASYVIRFSPRKPTSIWSAVNIRRAAELAAQPPSYRKLTSWWVVSAEKEETRLKRLEKLIEFSSRGKRIT